MFRLAVFGIALGAVVPVVAHAQFEDPTTTSRLNEYDARQTNRWYIAAGAGVIFPSDTELKSLSSGASVPANDIGLDTGYSLNAAFGTYLTPALRAEAEIAYRETDLDSISILGGSTNLPGKVTGLSLMGNLYYDHAITDRLGLYVGGGLGVTRVESDGVDGFLGTFRDGDDWVLSWQVMAGVAFHLTDQIALTGGYRLFGTEDYDFSGTKYDAPLIHGVEVGLRFSF